MRQRQAHLIIQYHDIHANRDVTMHFLLVDKLLFNSKKASIPDDLPYPNISQCFCEPSRSKPSLSGPLTDLLGLLDIRTFFVIGVLGPTVYHSSTGPGLRAFLDRLLKEGNAFQWVFDKLKKCKDQWETKGTGYAPLVEHNPLTCLALSEKPDESEGVEPMGETDGNQQFLGNGKSDNDDMAGGQYKPPDNSSAVFLFHQLAEFLDDTGDEKEMEDVSDDSFSSSGEFALCWHWLTWVLDLESPVPDEMANDESVQIDHGFMDWSEFSLSGSASCDFFRSCTRRIAE